MTPWTRLHVVFRGKGITGDGLDCAVAAFNIARHHDFVADCKTYNRERHQTSVYFLRRDDFRDTDCDLETEIECATGAVHVRADTIFRHQTVLTNADSVKHA
jgi:hypothetical protein